jgi:hypothetical protein
MSVGLGIFLGSVFLGTVFLYLKTRGEWNLATYCQVDAHRCWRNCIGHRPDHRRVSGIREMGEPRSTGPFYKGCIDRGEGIRRYVPSGAIQAISASLTT